MQVLKRNLKHTIFV